MEILGHKFKGFRQAVSWLRRNRPDITNPEAYVAFVERKRHPELAGHRIPKNAGSLHRIYKHRKHARAGYSGSLGRIKFPEIKIKI